MQNSAWIEGPSLLKDRVFKQQPTPPTALIDLPESRTVSTTECTMESNERMTDSLIKKHSSWMKMYTVSKVVLLLMSQ